MGQRPFFEFGDGLLDDRVVAVAFVGLDHAQRAVGDERVVAVGGEQFALLGSVRCQLLMAFDAAHDQPAVHVLALLPAGERGERHFGDLGIGDPALLGLLPDRLRVFDRSSTHRHRCWRSRPSRLPSSGP